MSQYSHGEVGLNVVVTNAEVSGPNNPGWASSQKNALTQKPSPACLAVAGARPQGVNAGLGF